MNFDSYRLRKGLILGFHGCDADIAAEVINGRADLRKSENAYDWLGHGVYFWENNPERAMEWARDATKRGRIKKPAVIGAILDLGLCLDLTESVGCEEVAASFAALSVMLPGGPVVSNRGGRDSLFRELDCLTINLTHDMRDMAGLPRYSSVRAAFHEGGELYTGAGFSRRAHIQICVRDLAVVLGYFLPRGRSEDEADRKGI